MAHSIDMCVYGHGRLTEGNGLHHISSLAANTWEFEQLVHVAGHLAAMIAHQHLCHGNEVLGLGIGIGNAFYVLKDFIILGIAKLMCRGIVTKKGWRNLIDALVGALSTKNNGHKQLECGAVVSLGGYLGHLLPKVGQHFFVSFLASHIYFM